MVGQLATEPPKSSGKTIKGRLRRTDFSEKRTEVIIKAYLEYLFCNKKIIDSTKTLDDYARLMTLKITHRDPSESQIDTDKVQIAPEVVFVDLLNTLNKLATNLNTVLHLARSKLTTLDPIALQRTVDQFADMSTRKCIREWTGRFTI